MAVLLLAVFCIGYFVIRFVPGARNRAEACGGFAVSVGEKLAEGAGRLAGSIKQSVGLGSGRAGGTADGETEASAAAETAEAGVQPETAVSGTDARSAGLQIPGTDTALQGSDRALQASDTARQTSAMEESAAAEGTENAVPPKYTASADTRLLADTGADTVTLLFAGDVLLDDRYAVMASLLERTGGKADLTKAFDAELLETMRSADIFMLNNEFPYSSRGAALEGKQYTFRARPAYAALLDDIGADIAALANNHMFDYGETALLDTLDTLSELTLRSEGKQALSVYATAADAGDAPAAGSPDILAEDVPDAAAESSADAAAEASGTEEEAGALDAAAAETAAGSALSEITGAEAAKAYLTGLPYVGAGRNLEEASAPFYFTNGKIKIGFISATQIERMANPDTRGATESSAGVFRCLDPEKLLSVIGEMQESCDFTVVYLHWGTESAEKADEQQKKLAKAAAAAGADLIIGDHPHVLQGIETVDGVPVVYSLGNYLFNSRAQDTGLVSVELDAETAELKCFRFLPCRQENCRTKLLSGAERERVLESMRGLSGVSIDKDGCVLLPPR